MKKIYFLFLLLTSFSFNEINAQSCPPNGTTADGGTTLFFIYDSGTSLCGSRPGTVTVAGSVFTLISCTDTLSTYSLTSGIPVSPPNPFTADFGSGIMCTYADGTLPIEDFEFLKATFKVYPNPLKKNNQLTVKFGTNIIAEINMYDVTGKIVISDKIDNTNKKQINTSSLTNGVYFIKLKTDKSTITKKVIIIQ